MPRPLLCALRIGLWAVVALLATFLGAALPYYGVVLVIGWMDHRWPRITDAPLAAAHFVLFILFMRLARWLYPFGDAEPSR